MKKILAVAAVASALFLSGCSQVGAAATVGDVKITQAKVQSSVDSILAARVGVDTSQMQVETGEALNRGQLRFFVLTALPNALVGAGIAADNLDTYIEAISLSEKISKALTASGISQADIGAAVQKLVVDKATKIGVTVNPRYGKWDGTVADVVATDPASSAVTPATK